MALLARMTRLLTADLHALMDRMEDPESLLAQAERDMAEAIAGDRQRLAACKAEQQALERHREQAARAAQTLEEELTLSLSVADDDLARSVVRRRLQQERASATLDDQADALRLRAERLEARIAAESQSLADINAEALRFRAASDTAPSQEGMISAEEVELALMAARRARGAKR
jgi:phage shock protein A